VGNNTSTYSNTNPLAGLVRRGGTMTANAVTGNTLTFDYSIPNGFYLVTLCWQGLPVINSTTKTTPTIDSVGGGSTVALLNGTNAWQRVDLVGTNISAVSVPGSSMCMTVLLQKTSGVGNAF